MWWRCCIMGSEVEVSYSLGGRIASTFQHLKFNMHTLPLLWVVPDCLLFSPPGSHMVSLRISPKCTHSLSVSTANHWVLGATFTLQIPLTLVLSLHLHIIISSSITATVLCCCSFLQLFLRNPARLITPECRYHFNVSTETSPRFSILCRVTPELCLEFPSPSYSSLEGRLPLTSLAFPSPSLPPPPSFLSLSSATPLACPTFPPHFLTPFSFFIH